MTGTAAGAIPFLDRPPARALAFTAGFLRGRVRRILTLAGLAPQLGLPRPDDAVLAWGRTPGAHRAERIAARRGVPLIRVEDAFLRSLRPGRSGEPPLGLMIDATGGVHFDPARPSALERLIAEGPLDDSALIARAREGMRRMAAAELAKYADHDPSAPLPRPPYVLLIDQLAGDAALAASRAGPSRFREMLYWAREENPGQRVVIKRHPEAVAGHRPGLAELADPGPDVRILDAHVSPRRLLEGASRVYTISSQMGFEAILAGHRPVVFGQPWYAGWGLTDDRFPIDRRQRRLTAAQLFAAAMILAPTWYDPCRDRLCSFEELLDHLEARARAAREDRAGWDATGISAWKRRHLRRFLGHGRGVRFRPAPDRPRLIWGARDLIATTAAVPHPRPPGVAPAVARTPPGRPVVRVEDGFLRSRGLGAELVPPLSLVLDRLGIHYDPTRPSELEMRIAEAARLPPEALIRAHELRRRIVALGLSKYNLGTPPPLLPRGRRVLVVGQVADDASVLLGARDAQGRVLTNADLLRRARAERPDAHILYKPHPDVEAGLRAGALPGKTAALADMVLAGVDPAALLAEVDEVWTLTSLLGFEALMRGLPVTCLGVPFYAGWGLTDDRGPVPARRRARPSLDALVHAALIAHPRYLDPVSGLPCPPEVIVERLAQGMRAPRGPLTTLLAAGQRLRRGVSRREG